MTDLDEQLRSINYLLQSGDIEKASSIAYGISVSEVEGELNSLKYSLIQQKIQIELGDYETVLKQAVEAEERARKLKENALLLQTMVNQIHANIALGLYEKARNKVEEAERLFESLTDRERMTTDQVVADLSNLKGLIMQNQGSYDEAVNCYEKALTLRFKLGLQRDIGLTQYNMGSVFETQGDLKKAADYYTMAENTFKGIDYYTGLSIVYNTLKNLYSNMGDADKVFEYEQNIRNLDEKTKLNRRLLDAAKEIRRLSDELSTANKERMELEQKLWSLEFQLNSLHADESDSFTGNQLEVAHEELDELRERNQEIAELLDIQREERDRLEKENVELKDSVDRLREELERSREQEARIQLSSKRMTELQEELDGEKKRSLKLETELANVRKELELANEELSRREIPSENALEEKERELQNVRNRYEEKLRKLEDTVKMLKEENERLMREHQLDVEKRDEELQSLQLKLKNLEGREPDRTEEELRDLTAKKQELVTELNSIKKEIEERKSELNELKSAVAESSRPAVEEEQRIPPAGEEHRMTPEEEMRAGTPVRAEPGVTSGEDARALERNLSTFKQDYQAARQRHLTTVARREERGRGVDRSLEDILSESKLAQQIYQLLQSSPSIQLRFLAMRLGVNMQTCRKEVEKLVGARYLTINTSQSEDNPLIQLRR